MLPVPTTISTEWCLNSTAIDACRRHYPTAVRASCTPRSVVLSHRLRFASALLQRAPSVLAARQLRRRELRSAALVSRGLVFLGSHVGDSLLVCIRACVDPWGVNQHHCAPPG